MNLAVVAALPLKAETRTWFRAVNPRFLPNALETKHTTHIATRFSPGPLGLHPFEILYLAENHLVALFEVGALFGRPSPPGGLVPHPGRAWIIVNVTVQLQAVADLTQSLVQEALQVSAQELTGDWEGYQTRSFATSVTQPTGVAPTQRLGEALFQDSRGIEAVLSLSARMPYHLSLMVFPQNLRPGSFVQFDWDDSAGGRRSLRIP